MLREKEIITTDSEEESENPDCSDTPLILHNRVVDRYYMVQLTFLFMGVGTLAPWNFFITAKDYWMYKFRDIDSNITTNETQLTDKQREFESYLEVANNGPFLLMLFLNTQIVDCISEKSRNIFGQLILICMFLMTSLFVSVNTDGWQEQFLILTLATVVLMSCACGIYQSSVVGMAASFPSRYICAVVNGQAVSGIFASVLLILCLAGDVQPQTSSLIYFLSAFTFLLITFIFYLIIRRKSYFQFHVQNTPRSIHSVLLDYQIPNAIPEILKKTWIYGLSVTLTFWVTLSVFPAVTTLVVSSNQIHHPLWATKFFLPVICFLFFNVSDLLGRLTAAKYTVPLSKRSMLLILALLRISLVPLLMLCNIQPHYYMPVLFPSDIIYAVLIIILGFTNGYIFSCSMMCGPKYVSEPLQEKCGIVLSACMGIGLCFGSLTSYLLVQIA